MGLEQGQKLVMQESRASGMKAKKRKSGIQLPKS